MLAIGKYFAATTHKILGGGALYYVFKWTLPGHFKPKTNATT